MNILFVSIAWPLTGESNLYTDLMEEFSNNGHVVYVIAATEMDLKAGQFLTTENGINVLRVNSGRIRKTSYLRKAYTLMTLRNRISSAVKRNLKDVRIDLIIGHTPPITLSALYRELKSRYKAPFYLLLKDIWPQSSVDHKIFSKFSLPWIYLRFHEIRIYRLADYIGCMSPMGVKYILSQNKFLDPEKLEVCPNAIKPTMQLKANRNEEIRMKYGMPTNACVFIFGGNLGKSHGLTFLIDAIKQLAEYKKAFFFISGSGTHFNFLEKSMGTYKGGNLMISRWIPREDFKLVLRAADVGLILLDKCYTVPQFPSRLLGYLDFSKPVICAVNEKTDIGTIMEKNNCGKAMIHGDLKSFVEAVKFLSENKKERLNMGVNARDLLEKEYTTNRACKIILEHFNATELS
jgi:glycosyltransferase involved in cell wall biosynthesis